MLSLNFIYTRCHRLLFISLWAVMLYVSSIPIQAADGATTEPPPPPNATGVPPPRPDGKQPGAAGTMTVQQTLSDEGQRNTIAFSALSFLTGSLGADSFFPPGKVADFWGFQYMRDNDPSEKGHNTDFLTKAANNMLSILNDSQKAELVTLAKSQVDSINEYAYQRFPLMKAFRRQLEGDLPTGSTGLDETAVKAYSAQLYRLDGEISLQRAQVMGGILAGLNATQRAALDALKGKGMLDWPDVAEQLDKTTLDHDVHVAVMTYAGDLFSWYLGSVEADVYFAPERQGTYFGSFYMKDAPAMGNPDYTISSTLTGDSGQNLLNMLTTEQSTLLTDLVGIQREFLQEIVTTREAVSKQLRLFMTGGTADSATVLSLMEKYGELDGEIIYNYATRFAQVGQSLTDAQRTQLAAMRVEIMGDFSSPPAGAYLYSNAIAMPDIPNTDFLFGVGSETSTTETGTTTTPDVNGVDTQSCSTDNSENVVYDLTSGVLILNRVQSGELWYYVELQDTGNLTFVIKKASVIESAQKATACYDMATLSLTIPRVTVSGQLYSAILKHTGDWRFWLQDAKLRNDTSANTSDQFMLTSPAIVDGELLSEYQCEPKVNGVEASIPLAWSNVPKGTGSLAVTMHHYPNPKDTSHLNAYLLLWDIDPTVTEIAHGAADDGHWHMGANKDGVTVSYTSPCSAGAGTHEYTLTLYALSQTPPSLPAQSSVTVTYDTLVQAISAVKVLGTATLTFNVTR